MTQSFVSIGSGVQRIQRSAPRRPVVLDLRRAGGRTLHTFKPLQVGRFKPLDLWRSDVSHLLVWTFPTFKSLPVGRLTPLGSDASHLTKRQHSDPGLFDEHQHFPPALRAGARARSTRVHASGPTNIDAAGGQKERNSLVRTRPRNTAPPAGPIAEGAEAKAKRRWLR